ncbi:MFS transporter [uncultured Clostridium sp.]|uniref:MFS transporter n=1 Tax=uncultured Clostridium sp. TaxID=59620 RepID=UPI00261F0195|nr:MFS transporter [uncultured Clostridium sp.]
MDKNKMKKILFINFITMATFNMAHPVTPSLINALSMPTYMFGVLYSTMSIAHFVMSPIWGSMSDHKGRKRFLVIGVIGYGISQLGFGFIESTPLILLFRITGGAMSVAFITTCIAYVSDISSKEERTKYMSYHTATTSIASSAGALIGGFCGGYGYKFAFLTQFILCLIVAGIIYFIVDETIDKKQGKIKIYTKHLKKGNNNTRLTPILSTMMIVMTLVTIATTSYNSESVLNMPTMVNGIVMAIAGFIALIMNLWINPYLSKKFNEKYTLVAACIISGISMVVASLFNNIILSFMFIMIFVGSSALVIPIQQSIVSKLAKDNYGEIMGIQGSYKAIGMIIGSLASGFIFDIGNKLPFILSGICCLIVCILMLRVSFTEKAEKITT